ncbi:AAA family ATPase [Spirosoma sp. KUDC1026]|uniref:AAA family ATPase n=1 Tax=Spirosoma sp. KUDC1026 TaxID=2745947 RepID=UPI00159B9BF9|nr:AAA family ATPase [Spirosoma sp. KUDC1026]QKZ14796.1 AAA family ATPase [Spirosoma sp. KUDC1026]
MKIQRLVIENFKSIERIELIEPNPFTVFVGPNGSGKSNIFEALEFLVLRKDISESILFGMFGGKDSIIRRQSRESDFRTECALDIVTLYNTGALPKTNDAHNNAGYKQFVNFCHLFVKNKEVEKYPIKDKSRLSLSAGNLEVVLKRILTNETLKEEVFEWLELFVPGFEVVEVDDRDELHWFEKSSPGYFTKDLISDGTYNILALLTAIYQSDKPQFLCTEEPENGLNPKVIAEFVNLCRYACEEFGHFIWLNTHSQSLVSQLTTDEIILVDKRDGATQIKQVKGMDLHDLPMDEAWLSNALGGGIPW